MLRSSFAHHWLLDPAITFLNHGSYGACPIPVLDRQRSLRTQLEQEPVYFFEHQYEDLLDKARLELAEFVGADPNHLVFVPNATTGVNTVLRSLTSGSRAVLNPGDELLVTNHEYNASRNALNFAAEQVGAVVVVAEIPFPLESADQVIDAVLDKVSARTRLLLIDHVTSQTGLVLPLQSLIPRLVAQGIEVLVDGAHAPGMVPLNLRELGATYYTGNCHKWLCAPKGAAFLYVQPDRQALIRPLTISHGANSPRCDRSRFHLEFDWTGTDDPTAYFCIPDAIQFMETRLPGGWSAVMEQNRSLALAARQRLCAALNQMPPCPESAIGSLAVLPLTDGSAIELKATLYDRYQIEVPVIPWHGSPNRLIRISAQLYNTLTDYDDLARALLDLLAKS